MKIASWNLSYAKNTDKKLKYLESVIAGDEFFVIMQEVLPQAYAEIVQRFSHLQVEYSLNYRPSGKFDTKARKLGIVIMASEGILIESANVLERTPFPDRTLLVNCSYQDKRFSVVGLHSITGCDYKKAKSLQFYSFAEEVDSYKPAIVAFDANEPYEDNISIKNMTFFDNKDKGEGAKTFFNTMLDVGLHECYSIADLTDKTNLPFSHKVKSTEKRYDFIFIDVDLFSVENVVYDYQNAVDSGSDHAAVVAYVNIRSR